MTTATLNFTLQNIFRITNAYYRLVFDTREDLHATYVEYLIRREGVSRYMEQEEVEAFARKLVKILR